MEDGRSPGLAQGTSEIPNKPAGHPMGEGLEPPEWTRNKMPPLQWGPASTELEALMAEKPARAGLCSGYLGPAL